MGIKFLNKEHIDRYERAKNSVRFENNTKGYASFTYLLTSDLLYEACSNVFYPTFGLEKALDILENDKFLSTSQQRMLKLELDLYISNSEGDSIIQVFSCFDETNRKVALEAQKIYFSLCD